MTIALRPMRRKEFEHYRAHLVTDYAAEIARNFHVSLPTAKAQAEHEIARDLPDGIDTAGQVLSCIIDDELEDTAIGFFWYQPDKETRIVFIADFSIVTTHRGKGFGTRALALLERELADAGHEQIRLRVAADNPGAQHVYRSRGFRITGFSMSRAIGSEQESSAE